MRSYYSFSFSDDDAKPLSRSPPTQAVAMAPLAAESCGFSSTARGGGAEAVPLIAHGGRNARAQHRRSNSLGGGDREDGVRDGPAAGVAAHEVLQDPDPEVASSRAGTIFTFGVVATIVLLLGVVGVKSGIGGPAGGRGGGRGGAGGGDFADLGAPSWRSREGIGGEGGGGKIGGDGGGGGRGGLVRGEVPPPRRENDIRNNDHVGFAARTSTTAAIENAARATRWKKDREGNARPGTYSRLGQAASGGGAAGVSLNGWLHLEEWFFSSDAYSLVDAADDAAQGTVFPPVFTTPEALGFQWASEGDLVAKLQATLGDDATIAAFKAHRDNYLLPADLEQLKALGYAHVRLPVTWACFFGKEEAEEAVVQDPAHPGAKQVTVSRAALNGYLGTLAAAGVDVLVDMHNMPGGSSLGTYNGVFPNAPRFWDDDNLKAVGRGILREMMHWYVGLPPDLKKAVSGFTLLNEPAHFLRDKKQSMLAWYAAAVRDYRDVVVAANVQAGLPVPKLYVNMIETSGMDVRQTAAFMKNHFTPAELADWAVMDVHVYLAWEHNGCDDGSCAWSCSTDPGTIRDDVGAVMRAKLKRLNDAAAAAGVARAAVSEWSLATHHDSAAGCQSDAVIDAVYDAQSAALSDAGVTSFFWGWKMPSAGTHQKFWSMEYFQSRVHSPRMTLGASDGAAAAPGPPGDGGGEGKYSYAGGGEGTYSYDGGGEATEEPGPAPRVEPPEPLVPGTAAAEVPAAAAAAAAGDGDGDGAGGVVVVSPLRRVHPEQTDGVRDDAVVDEGVSRLGP